MARRATDAAPGSDEKLAVLAARAAAGELLFHDDDLTVAGMDDEAARGRLELAGRIGADQRGRRRVARVGRDCREEDDESVMRDLDALHAFDWLRTGDT